MRFNSYRHGIQIKEILVMKIILALGYTYFRNIEITPNFKKDFQKRLSKKTFKKDFQKRLSKKTFKKDFQKRLSKKTFKKDITELNIHNMKTVRQNYH
jgi:hypothetical protein